MRPISKTLVLLVVISITFIQAHAQSGYTFAGGLRLSTPAPTLSNAITVKYFIKENAAVEGIISFGSRFGLGALYEKHQVINGTPGFQWFYGGGGYLGFGDNKTYLGPTGIIGLDYKFDKIPLNLSLDWKPELDILPSINFVPDAIALSARFTFK
jgi:hypothetical protein